MILAMFSDRASLFGSLHLNEELPIYATAVVGIFWDFMGGGCYCGQDNYCVLIQRGKKKKFGKKKKWFFFFF